MKSPFKFLDAYTLQDKQFFFGRKEEIDALYQMVFQTPLLLIYGLSGTGKTSLIQCGLASRFDGPDWFPLFIRRQTNINESLEKVLIKAAKGKSKGSIVKNLNWLYQYYLRPTYLIFDQLEELFILGTEEEQEVFIQHIETILNSRLPCKIIFVMREEYIGRLYEFEKKIPQLFDFRLRVERMNNLKVKAVMLESFKKFNIQLEKPTKGRKNLCDQMIDNISAKQSGIQLPYLQVYLDLLYQEDYKKAYGNKAITDDLPPLEFTQEEIDDFGEIEEVLNKFQHQQKIYLQKTLQKKHGDFPAEGVREVLDAFVTIEGTKRPIYYYRAEGCIFIHPAYQKYFPKLDDSALSDVIEELEKVRLLRATTDSFELAHDSLAKLIDEQRTDEERQRNEIFRQLLGSYTEHQMTNQFLTKKQLLYYENHLPFLKLNEDILEFIKDSEQVAIAEEEKERKAQEEKIQIMEEKLAAEEKARERQQFFSGIIGIIAILTIISSVFAYLENQNARNELQQRQKEEIRRTLVEKEKIDLEIKELRSDAKTLYQGGRILFSIKKLEMALQKDSTNQEVKEELEFYRQEIKNKKQ